MQRVWTVNLAGTFNTCQAFARTVVDQGTTGAIVNVTSAAGLRGVPNATLHSFVLVVTTKTSDVPAALRDIKVGDGAQAKENCPVLKLTTASWTFKR